MQPVGDRVTCRAFVVAVTAVATWIALASAEGESARGDEAPAPGAAVGEPGSLSHSARMRTDRRVQAAVQAARQRLAAGDHSQAARLLRDVLDVDAPAVEFVPVGSTWIPAHDAVLNLIQQLPAELRETFDELDGPAARAMLIEARSNSDEASLRRLVARRPSFVEAAEAAFDLSRRDLDHGQFTAAAEGFRFVRSHPRVDPARRVEAAAFEVVALSRSGRGDEGRALWESLSELRPKAPRGMPAGIDPLREFVRREVESPRPPGRPLVHAPGAVAAARFDAAWPSLHPAWSHRATPPAELAALLKESLDELRGQGIAPIPSAMPLVSGNFAAARVLDDVVVFDLATGAERWRRPAGSAWKQLGGNLRLLQNDGLSDLVSRRLAYRVQADSLYSRLASDGTRLFGLVEGDSIVKTAGRQTVFGAGRGNGATIADPHNWLVAWDLSSGRELWRLGGPAPDPAGPPQAEPPHRERMAPAWANGIHFLGAPLPVDSVLCVVGRSGDALTLHAVYAATGEPAWNVPLAELSTATPPGDARPLPPACPVVLHRGALLCPTGNGCLVSVDLAQRRATWAARHPRDDWDRFGNGGPTQWNRQLQFPWWDAWRETTVLGHDDVVILAGPDSRAIRGFDRTTGRLVWVRPRGDGLMVSGIVSGTLVVGHRSHVEGIDARSGATFWTTATGPLGGRGHVGRTTLLQPLADGGLLEIDVATGRILRRADGTGTSGNVLAFPEGLLVQDGGPLVRLSPLDSQAEAARTAARERPGDPAALARWALAEEESRRHEAADAAWSAARSIRDDASLRAAWGRSLLTRLRESPADAEATWDRLEPLLDTPALRIEALDALAAAHATAGRPEASLAARLRLLELGPTGRHHRRPAGASELFVRFDRHAQGEIVDLHEGVDAATRATLDDLMRRAFEQALESPDPFSVQRFADRHAELPLGRFVRAREATRAGLGAGFFKSQLSLLSLSEDADARLSGRALHQYAELMKARGWRTDAALAFRRLRDEFATVECDDSRTGKQAADAAATDPLLAEAIASAPRDAWPQTRPAINVSSERPRDADFLILPVEPSPGSLFERMTVSVDRNGRKLRFFGGEQNGHWDLSLPDSPSMFRTAHPLHRGWGLGHLLVARIGCELFGIAALDERGERNASIVWRLDMTAGRSMRWNQLGVRMRSVPAGFGIDEVAVVDRFGRDLGQVGPVAAGCLCYRDQARLVAIDPATGDRLWERLDLPQGATVQGNGAQALLLHSDRRTIEVIRTLDGRTTVTRKLAAALDDDTRWFGTRALTRTQSLLPSGEAAATSPEGGPAVAQAPVERLELIDAIAGQRVWSRTFELGARACGLGPAWIGVVEPSGRFHVVDVVKGRTVASQRVEVPAGFDRLFVTDDERRHYVAIGSAFADPNNQRAQQERGGFRNPGVNGRLMAVSRRDGKVEWSAPMDDAALALDQPRESPFLVLQFWRAVGR